jgi:S-adenosylmethionine hydrolase
VGVCHAVIHARCPEARIVDLAHNIRAFDIRKGAAAAAAGVYQLPNAVHLVVVDPGVGGGRRDLCLTTGGGVRMVGPDNGVLIPAARRAGGVEHAYAIDHERLGIAEPLGTFHARDVLAPAAAALACGASPDNFGESIDPSTLADAPFPQAAFEGGQFCAEVLEIDRFGSMRLSLTGDELMAHSPGVSALEVALAHVVLTVPFARTFSDVAVGELVALVDASGWLTLAENTGSAYERLGVDSGAHVRVRALP